MPTKKTTKTQKMDGLSADVGQEKIDALKQLVPEIFSDGKIDAEKLKRVVGENNIAEDERYRLEWAGKSEVFDEIAKRSACTLTLDEKRSSKDWDKSNNIFIEGENLEVLRMLQKAYHGKVKMIYIDPPYNTGKDFVYNDNFRVTEEEYCDDACNVDENGNIKKALKLNSKDNGRFHSNWLSMIYPRLYMARNLLRDDGIIFVSINDFEASNLRLVMNEIFGEDNSLTESPTTLIWSGSGTTAGHFASAHEYILCYAKNKSSLPFFKLESYGDESMIAHGALKKISKANPASAVQFPAGIEFEGDSAIFSGEMGGSEKQIIEGQMVFENGKLKLPVTITAGWAMKDSLVSWLNGEETYDTKGQKITRFFFNKEGMLWYEKERGTIHPKTTLERDVVGTTKKGSTELELLFGFKPFDYPKPSTLIKYLVSFTTSGNDLILDFFSGSGTTAHAVLAQNAEDKGNRQYICVQMPEETQEGSDARKAGYKKISDIAIDRIKKSAEIIQKEHPELKGHLGVRVYKETDSHFPQWHARAFESDDVLKQAMIDYGKASISGTPLDRATEVLLKLGYELTTPLEERKGYFVTPDSIFLVLDLTVSMENLKKILGESPKTIVVLEKLFKKDEDKINFGLRCKESGVIFQTI